MVIDAMRMVIQADPQTAITMGFQRAVASWIRGTIASAGAPHLIVAACRQELGFRPEDTALA